MKKLLYTILCLFLGGVLFGLLFRRKPQEKVNFNIVGMPAKISWRWNTNSDGFAWFPHGREVWHRGERIIKASSWMGADYCTTFDFRGTLTNREPLSKALGEMPGTSLVVVEKHEVRVFKADLYTWAELDWPIARTIAGFLHPDTTTSAFLWITNGTVRINGATNIWKGTR